MNNTIATGCRSCIDGADLGFDISMAYQPIVDMQSKTVFAYEALVRGVDGAGAGEVLSRVNDDNRYVFDQTCRVRAIETAARLGLSTKVSINFLPNAVYRPEACIRTTLAAAQRVGLPERDIIFEVTEGENLRDPGHLVEIFRHYRSRGFLTAIDDFGAGHSGLNLLADFQPDIIKIDMALVRDIHLSKPRQAIVRGTMSMALDLNIKVIAEGIETPEEYHQLQEMGVCYYQGYYFARPGFEALPQIAPSII